MPRTVQITLRTNRPLAAAPDPARPEALLSLTPLGLVVGEHVDKLGFFEPALTVLDKTLAPDRVTFTLCCADTLAKPLDEIVRGFRIGCFRIAREYRLVSPADPTPVFADGFDLQELPSQARSSGRFVL